MKTIRFLLKNMYVNGLFCSLIFLYSCNQSPVISPPEGGDELPDVSSFEGSALFCDLNVVEDLTFQEKYLHISEVILDHRNTTNPLTLQQSMDFRDEMVDYFVNENQDAFDNSYLINVTDNYLNIVNDFVIQMKDITHPDQIDEVAGTLRNTLNNLAVSSQQRSALTQMIETYQETSTCLYQQFADEFNSDGTVRAPWIKCKWFQWVCVGAMTAAAVALIAASGGALLAVIAGGATVAMVAACCFCRCKCNFTSSCQ